MVKKVTRTSNGQAPSGLGYVLNDDLLDEILGEYDPSLAPPGKKRAAARALAESESGLKHPVKKSVNSPPAKKREEKMQVDNSNNKVLES